MNFHVAVEHPPLRAEPDGTVRVGPTRVTLDSIVSAYQSGATAEQIVAQYPSLSLADAYESIGYYLRHTQEVDTYLAERVAHAKKVRQEIESDRATQQIRAQLIARRGVTTEQ